MKTNMLSNLEALREFWCGPLGDLIIKIMGEEGSEFLEELKKFLRKKPCWALGSQPKSDLIKYLGTVTIPATTGKFIARDHFKLDTSENTKVAISYLGDNLKEWFLNGKGKIEEPKGETTLCFHTLAKSSVDIPIITELGGEKVETSLQEVFALMQKQPKGEDGAFITNGHANLFYVRDVSGALRALFVIWRGDGWNVHALSVGLPNRWLEGIRVFSR